MNLLTNEERLLVINLTEEEKIGHIHAFNLRQELPRQASDEILYNRAFFDNPIIVEELFGWPAYHFTHPLSDYPQTTQHRLLTEYAVQLARINSPRTSSVQVEDRKQFICIITHEVNQNGYWTLVQRTVFLHKPLPCSSTDIIAPSNVAAPTGHNNRIKAPDGIDYPN